MCEALKKSRRELMVNICEWRSFLSGGEIPLAEGSGGPVFSSRALPSVVFHRDLFPFRPSCCLFYVKGSKRHPASLNIIIQRLEHLKSPHLRLSPSFFKAARLR